MKIKQVSASIIEATNEEEKESKLSEIALDICDAIIEDGKCPAGISEKAVRSYIKRYIKEGRYAPEIIPKGKEFVNMVDSLYWKMTGCYNWERGSD